MSTRNICNLLKMYGNCYSRTYPSNSKIEKIERICNCKIRIRECTLIEEGYIIEKDEVKR